MIHAISNIFSIFVVAFALGTILYTLVEVSDDE
jgi:hypothetical protein